MAVLRSLIDSPKYTLMRGPARFSAVRNLVSAGVRVCSLNSGRRYGQKLLAQMDDTLFPDVILNEHVESLRTTGAGFGLKLQDKFVNEILRYSETHPVFAFRNERLGFLPKDRKKAEKALGKEILLAEYYNTLDDCRAIHDIAGDPVLNWIALKYLGCVPKFLGVRLWWTYPVTPNKEDQLQHAHYFHRDIDDFKFLKFFFYLSEVEKGDGGHWLVSKSHFKAPHIRAKDRFITRRFEDDEIIDYYGKENIIEVTGPRGTGFSEDTLCVHKAATPSKNPRLILQLQFGLFNLVPRDDRRLASELVRIC